jgi:hypothetical protein
MFSKSTNNLIRLNQYEESNHWNTQSLDYKLIVPKMKTLKVGGSLCKTSFQQPDRKFITGVKLLKIK